MDDTTPHPHTPARPPATPAADDGAEFEFLIRATHQLRRVHDGSVISTHCSGPCGTDAMQHLSRADLIGPNPPGPLEWVEVELVDVHTGVAVAFTRALTPLSGSAIDLPFWP